MNKNIVVIEGDGVGKEIITQSVRILESIGEVFNHSFNLSYCLMGAIAIDEKGTPLPEETLNKCVESDAVLFGAIGDPKYDNDPEAKVRPEQGLLQLRKSLELYANLRPIKVFPELQHLSPLKPEKLDGVDFIICIEALSTNRKSTCTSGY